MSSCPWDSKFGAGLRLGWGRAG